MKRSAHIGLLVMGALTTTTAAGYFASNHDQACQARAANNPQAPQPQDCRRSVWSGSGGHSYGGRPIFAGTPTAAAAATTSVAPAGGSSSVQRGGFGGFASHIAHAFSGS
jgi:hypothetical protein